MEASDATASVVPSVSPSPTPTTRSRPYQPFTPEQRERYNWNRIHWLRSLLPPQVFLECVHRLRRGDTPVAVARWLKSQPDLESIANYAEHTMRTYLGVLGRSVAEQQRGKQDRRQAVTTSAIAEAVEIENQAGRALDRVQRASRKVMTFEDQLADWNGLFNLKAGLQAAIYRIWDTWEQVRKEVEELKAKNLPDAMAFTAQEVALAQTFQKLCDSLRQVLTFEFVQAEKGLAMGMGLPPGYGGPGGFSIPSGMLPGDRKQNLSEDAKKVMAEFDACSPADRMLMREGFNAALRVSEMIQANPNLARK